MKIYGTFLFIVFAVFRFSPSSSRDILGHSPTVCRTNEDCTFHEACHLDECIDICKLDGKFLIDKKCEDDSFCAMNSEHSAFCACYTGYNYKPDGGCIQDPKLLRSCNTDEDCTYHNMCHEKKCIDVCQYYNGSLVDNKCGTNAYCLETSAHTAECFCYSFYYGDPYSHCVEERSLEKTCNSNNDCPVYDACYNHLCVDACRVHNGKLGSYKCGRNAYCYTSYAHAAFCKCLPNHAGDPYTGCKKVANPAKICQSNDDCPFYTACHDYECVDVCKLHNGKVVDHKCGINAFCYETASHVADCTCYRNHSGDPYSSCEPDFVATVRTSDILTTIE